MNSDTPFLEAIRANPHDVATRLVYADWLEERGDPRGELIRIEEEMRPLPVFADRFWELKPRRNTSREGVATDWLEVMRYGPATCNPVFSHGIPNTCNDRWRFIREYTERWFRVSLPDIGGRTTEIREAESRLKRTLPPSMREWVAFAHDIRQLTRTRSNFHFVLRDIYMMQELAGLSAISLLMQTEGDYHWAVLHKDLGTVDPPVNGFWGGDAREDGTFLLDESNPTAATLTAFGLSHALAYTRGEGGGFRTIVDPRSLVRQLRETFPIHCSFGNTEIFELDNIQARLSYRSSISTHLNVEVFKQMPRKSIPEFLWDYTHSGGSSHGMFTLDDHRISRNK